VDLSGDPGHPRTTISSLRLPANPGPDPLSQTAAGLEGFPASIEVRTSLNPSAAAPKIRQILKQVNPNLILRSMTTLEDQIDATLVQERLLVKLLGFFVKG